MLPVLLCVAWSWVHAKNERRNEAEAAAQIVRVQVETILSQAWSVLDRVAELTPKPCAEVLPLLQRWSALNPYIRALILASSDHIYCSSVIGAVDFSVGDFRNWPIRSESWKASSKGAELIYDEVTRNNGRVALTINVRAPAEGLVNAWQQLLLSYLPVALLIGAGLAFAAYRLQVNRLSFKEQLRSAMRANEFQVYYQPVYGQLTGQCEGAEALMRWNRPGVGFVRPDIFIAAAEAEGMIIPLTQHLLRLIERDMQTWATPPDFHIGVNIAPEHLSGTTLVSDIQAFRANIAARQPLVVLEITERSLIADNGQARRNIDALRAEGVRVAIDDFGTGHCSLSYLQKFPVDYLKIDKGFVHAILPSGEEAPVLDVIITLSHRLNLAVVAEGVETQVQFDYLTARGVAFIQGYLFARPMPSADFVRWYVGHSPPGAVAAAAQRPVTDAPDAA